MSKVYRLVILCLGIPSSHLIFHVERKCDIYLEMSRDVMKLIDHGIDYDVKEIYHDLIAHDITSARDIKEYLDDEPQLINSRGHSRFILIKECKAINNDLIRNDDLIIRVKHVANL